MLLSRARHLLGKVDGFAAELKAEADADLKKRSLSLRYRAKSGEASERLLPECFALVREAGDRKLSMRHFDVQIIGGTLMFHNSITEMQTGEGKTLTATLPTILASLAGKGAHIATVNDYLARRDAEWMGPLYELLGLTVGSIQHDMPDDDRRAAYASDITFGTNNEFGFDYLRDNMKFRAEDMVQPVHNYAIVDEVDSILVDEARTPLIISGPAEKSTELYYKIDRVIPALNPHRLRQPEIIHLDPGSPHDNLQLQRVGR